MRRIKARVLHSTLYHEVHPHPCQPDRSNVVMTVDAWEQWSLLQLCRLEPLAKRNHRAEVRVFGTECRVSLEVQSSQVIWGYHKFL